MRNFFAAFALIALAIVQQSNVANAQDWPDRPIRMIVGFPPGGSPDVVGRIVGEKLSQRLGQPVIVENAVGAAGVTASERVSRSAPDGYTMIMLTGAHSGTAAMRKKLPYDAINAFSMISMVTAYPLVLMVAPDSPIKSFPDLLARAKAAPDTIKYASNAPGSAHHLLGEWINIEAHTTMVPVPYRGAAQALVDLLGGRVDFMVDTATTAIEPIRSGQVRGLAVASPQRFPLLPDVPTVAEVLPGVETMSWLGLAMPAGAPSPIIDRLSKELKAILDEPDMKQRLSQLGGVPSWTTPDQMRDRIAGEIARWNRVIDEKKIERQ
ncbi:Bug family tripartite tricarboxylate transporter substrate binding protein [Undibacter mobilis]|uniref:Tripartite tricarboxylate transporter substrate binding protein n=1 Tax=Undibacter mobilis TaxID=2292256 RepID=A0A371B9N1_9BRAD|nr:tripartite tricarboxylate transporter substrate binding protein [Undibacter mobilis]RDV04286.1 tripartite tricarboxylate transporter substrate binding protein [Undibacter mobilis]